MSKKRQLILLRSQADLPRIGRLISRNFNGQRLIVALDPELAEMLLGKSGVQATYPIEQSESFHEVAADVIAIVGHINSWLANLTIDAPEIPPEVMTWPSNVEGGVTNQRVQDALLLIRSYLRLIDENNITEVHAFPNESWLWEDCVLRECARSRGLDFCRGGTRFVLRVWGARLWNYLRPFAVGGYYFVNIWRLRRGSNPAIPAKPIVFQLFGSSRKNIENVAPIMRVLHARGQPTAAWCWTASERYASDPADRQLTRAGIPAIRLERNLRWSDLAASLGFSIRCWRQSGRRQMPDISFRGVPLNGLLRPSFRHFFIAELPQRFRFFRALERNWPRQPPVALKIWGGPESFEGQITIALLRRGPRPILFHYWIGASMDWPYAAGGKVLDLFLAKSSHEAELAAREYRLGPGEVMIVGQARIADHTSFALQTSPALSRQALRLPTDGRLYVGYDPNCNLRGFQSLSEQIQMLGSLLNVARRQSGLRLVIKPHPSYPIGRIAKLISEAHLPNVFVLAKTAPIEHFLNACDVIVTKYSALILEAALMRLPSISVLLAGNLRFKIYGDIPEVVQSTEELENLLKFLGEDEKQLTAWKDTQLLRQQFLLPKFYHQPAMPPSEAAADAILSCLKDHEVQRI